MQISPERKPSETDKDNAIATDAITVYSPVASMSEKPTLSRPPSVKHIIREQDAPSRAWITRSASLRGATASGTVLSSLEPEFWRSRAGPLPPLPPRQLPRSQPSHPNSFLPPPLAFPESELFILEPEESLEEVDFSELDKLVGIAEPATVSVDTSVHPETPRRPTRPVASDFFDNELLQRESVVPTRSDVASSWRRRVSVSTSDDHASAMVFDVQHGLETVRESGEASSSDTKLSLPSSTTKPSTDFVEAPLPASRNLSSSAEHAPTNTSFPQTLVVPSHPSSQRSPRSAVYREVSMSMLDDTMSRIKGALDGMQVHDVHRESQRNGFADLSSSKPLTLVSQSPPHKAEIIKPPKWVPPALRPRGFALETSALQENFDVTATEPPMSPKPPWAYTVRFPEASYPIESLSRKQMHLWKSPPSQVRWDILSFDPPVENMTRKDFSLNDILFRKLPILKGRHRYKVVLPKPTLLRSMSGISEPINPKGTLPAKPSANKFAFGAFGKPREADDVASWRQRPSASDSGEKAQDCLEVEQLETVSRSPPPDNDATATIDISSKADSPVVVSGSIDGSLKPRTQPKMPAGVGVAFYRDSQSDGVHVKSPVQFIVTSELEDEQSPRQTISLLATDDARMSPPTGLVAGMDDKNNQIGSAPQEQRSGSLSREKTESKSSDDSVRINSVTFACRFSDLFLSRIRFQ